ncbi:HNH endonuclease [Shewanella sp. Scap07]|uniref:HNH endonuclease n=1 Tax=Shewanella sp. Scap07 TaxID=2589987 RepID=UPI0015B9AFAE|nr:HNH endonuclease [Shewanella sp. Scap07]QLE85420.1 HNH endonuclease [Shewanella sp. Scap07]
MRLNLCVICGATDGLENHHIIPRAEGGSDEDTNILTLCTSCHANLHHIQNRKPLSELVKKKQKVIRASGRFDILPSWIDRIDNPDGTYSYILNEDAKDVKLVLDLLESDKHMSEVKSIMKKSGLNWYESKINRLKNHKAVYGDHSYGDDYYEGVFPALKTKAEMEAIVYNRSNYSYSMIFIKEVIKYFKTCTETELINKYGVWPRTVKHWTKKYGDQL